VVVPQIASVRGNLVDVGLVGRAVVFKLQDHHGATDQEDHVGAAATLPRKFVLEDNVRIAELTKLVMKHLETMVPSTLLRVASRLKGTRLMMKAKLAPPVAFVHAEEGVN
jgi:hypothetical protein